MKSTELRAFIVTPIGDDNSEIRRAAEGVIDAVIIPKLIDAGFQEENITVAHRISTSGSINKQLITRIIEDDLVIANLTNLNPNVMYELAIRHAVRKPIIQICETGTRLPFDIVDERTIFYKNDMQGVLDLGTGLENYISEALNDDLPDNPIYRAIEAESIIKQSEKGDIDINKYFIERLDSLESSISQMVPRKTQDSIAIGSSKISLRLNVTFRANTDIENIEVFKKIREVFKERHGRRINPVFPKSKAYNVVNKGEESDLRISLIDTPIHEYQQIVNTIFNIDNEQFKVVEVDGQKTLEI